MVKCSIVLFMLLLMVMMIRFKFLTWNVWSAQCGVVVLIFTQSNDYSDDASALFCSTSILPHLPTSLIILPVSDSRSPLQPARCSYKWGWLIPHSLRNEGGVLEGLREIIPKLLLYCIVLLSKPLLPRSLPLLRTITTRRKTAVQNMGGKRVLVGYGVDIDAVAGWLGSYGGEDSTSDISRGKPQAARGVTLCIVTNGL